MANYGYGSCLFLLSRHHLLPQTNIHIQISLPLVQTSSIPSSRSHVMLSIMVTALGLNVNSSMCVQLVTQPPMVSRTVHIFFKTRVQDNNMTIHGKGTGPFGAEAFQEEVPCQEVTDLIVDEYSGTSNLDIFSLAQTPIKINALKHELKSYNTNEAQFILNGFVHGFPINYVGLREPSESKNLKSASSRPEITQQKTDKEVAERRVGGPFPYPPMPTLRVSPLGLVEKKHSGDFRLIYHLSHPLNNSVNDYIILILSYAMLNMQVLTRR